MGMDLIPVNDIEGFHVNWTGWSTLGDLLEECGVDLSAMAGSNDGDMVTAEIAQTWANALKDNLEKTVILRYKDDSFHGGYRNELHVTDSKTPVLLSTHEMVEALFSAANDRPVKPAINEPPTVINLCDSESEYLWIASFIEFLQNSGGFEQW